MGKTDHNTNHSRCSCELCNYLNGNPIDIEKHGAILVTVRIKVNNVCIGKKVAVAAIIYDKCHRILAFKGFVTMASGCTECGSIERKIIFAIPEDEVCDPDELDVRTVANYIYPCEQEI